MTDRADNVRAFPSGKAPALSRLRRASSVDPEDITWLSTGRLAAGKISVIDGDPGLGKSQITTDWAARITTGRALPGMVGWTDDEPVNKPRNVIMLSAEDGEGDTIVPRLIAAGANLDRVFFMDMVIEDGSTYLPTLDANMADIENQIEATNAALLIVDPLFAYIGGGVDTGKDHHIRNVLSPLKATVERNGTAVVVLRHLNKAMGMATLYRGGGSIGIIGAARVGLIAFKDDEDQEGKRRILAIQKSNLAEDPPSLMYRVVGVNGGKVSRIEWLGETHKGVEAMTVGADRGDKAEASEAEVWLANVLAEGPIDAVEIYRLGQKQGFSQRTLRRSKDAVGAFSQRKGFGPGSSCSWALNTATTQARAYAPTEAKARFRVASDDDPFSEDDA